MNHKRVLCVCSANMLRSPTIAFVLSQEPYNYDTRSCGSDLFYALIPITKNLIEWADEIVCADEEHAQCIRRKFREWKVVETMKVLNIPDDYEYRQPELIELIRERYNA